MTSETRMFCVGGNWKMNGNSHKVDEIANNIRNVTLDPNVQVIIAVPSVYLKQALKSFPTNVEVAAQNCYKSASGAYTGEISPTMIKDVGVNWVIIGHSERRTIFMETDVDIAEKIALALDTGLKVIACIGENQEEREAGKTQEVIFRQCKALVPSVGAKWSNVILAYEPVWAIGTGKTASPEQAQEVHAALRKWFEENVSVEVAAALRIQYGGSVNAENAKELALCPDIDGFLVGGASMKNEFIDIVNVNIMNMWTNF